MLGRSDLKTAMVEFGPTVPMGFCMPGGDEWGDRMPFLRFDKQRALIAGKIIARKIDWLTDAKQDYLEVVSAMPPNFT
jgi:hypothetical protein